MSVLAGYSSSSAAAIKNMFQFVDSDEEWRKCGAFQVNYFKDGYVETVIVDDYFPVSQIDGKWAFAKGQDGKELWPVVLEKAYAKLYGSFANIEAGKVQYALQDMTDNGFPESCDLKVESANINAFWEKLKSLRRHGALMGAGTPENALGDKAINEMGIVQGHAYGVLDVAEVDGQRLVQIRNPHGHGGSEWKGDWCDGSEKWNERMKNKLNFSDKEDGVFWMDVLDFVQQYATLSVCRILKEEDGWKEIKINDEWIGKSAEGLPTKTNPNARLDFNPQYEIKVTKPCDGFVMLKQMDKVNMFKGKHSIFFMVSKLNGQRIKKVDKSVIVCRSGNPINFNIVTSECDFDRTVSYPYKFTLMLANGENGAAGEGKFEASVYATDPNFTVTKLPFPADMEN